MQFLQTWIDRCVKDKKASSAMAADADNIGECTLCKRCQFYVAI